MRTALKRDRGALSLRVASSATSSPNRQPLRSCTALALALCLACGGVLAKPKHGSHPPADVSGKFDYYVMSLSWSPTFCESHHGNPQCEKHLGFVLHGLWPQNQGGGHPEQCATSERLTDDARALGLQVFPTEQLMAHEWQKHGTCNGSTALAYFQAAQQAVQSIKVPPPLEPGDKRRTMTSQQIAKLVRDANPAITNRSLALVCVNKELAEVRVCLAKDLTPRACGSKVGSTCGTGAIKLPGAQ